MSLFQKSVVNKYLKTLDSAEVEKSFLKFKEFYGNQARLENIRLLKEENYQEGFLREIFVQVLGYTINPDENYNLTTEFKNLTDAKKADGAILDDGKAIGVIELKSTKTTSLESITEQAFNYKNHQPNCRYIITSNFEKIRFYIDNATDFEEFNLFTLSKDDFKILYLILSKESIFNEIPLKLKKESVLHEENISKQLYQDYSNFKHKIFENLVQNNPQFDKLTLFKKSQKLLDRFLFVLFGEDSGLVPPNAVSKIIDQWKALEELDESVSLYSRFKKLFHHLDVGHKYTTFEIPAYNGGLFREDEILDKVQIDDEILLNDSLKLSAYDFQTEIDVNILGHMFENSLNEIEEMTAELEGKVVDKKKTKRKKEGVYYTPKYITKYIVENTVGELCKQKKNELNLDEIDISNLQNSRTKQGKLNKKAVVLLARLKTYSDYLLSLKILDPACGSGAFLNQTLEFLLEEHKFVDEIRRQLEKDSLGLFDIKKSILESNIYGVDINEESVEIAKLSLWLRTAERGRKLSDLNNNIKCGNSLIDDPEIAGEKAFKWENEFSEIMENGGFDAVVGNPPYGELQGISNKKYFEKEYKTVEGRFDLFELFIERALTLVKNGKIFSFIIPNTILSNLYSRKLRKFIIDNYSILEISNFGIDVFDDPTIHNCILTIKNGETQKTRVRIQVNDPAELSNKFDYSISQFEMANNKNNTFDIFISPNEKSIFKKAASLTTLIDICHIRQCIKTGNDSIYVMKSDVPLKDPWKKSLRGKSIRRYSIIEKDIYLKYGDWLARNWKNKSFYETPKIVIRETGKRIIATIDEEHRYLLSSLYSIYPKNDFTLPYLKSILAIINSKFSTFFIHKLAFGLTKGAFTKVRTNQLGRLPIPVIDSSIEIFINEKVNQIFLINSQLFDKQGFFLKRLKDNFDTVVLNQRIINFYEYDFRSLISILKKQGINLTLFQQDEWANYFNSYKSKISILKSERDELEKEIDQKIYNLYGLTEEEIQIIENSFENNN